MQSEREEKMTNLSETLLQKLSNWRPQSPSQPLEIADAVSGWKVAIQAVRADEMACMVWEVQVGRTNPLPSGAPYAERAGRLAESVTGLMEPLRVVEIDDARGEAQLRSAEPRARGTELFFHELMVDKHGAATLRRFRSGPATPRREQVAFTMTHEALTKLINDLTRT
jgi:hypothetical protein